MDRYGYMYDSYQLWSSNNRKQNIFIRLFRCEQTQFSSKLNSKDLQY